MLEVEEWCLRWKLLKGLVASFELLEAVFVLALYMKWMGLAMSEDCLWLVNCLSLGLVERLEVVQALEEALVEALEEQCWLNPEVVIWELLSSCIEIHSGTVSSSPVRNL